jgi:hypothetical protein
MLARGPARLGRRIADYEWPMSKHAHEVVEAWGFDYVTEIVWNKPSTGPGFWARNKHEVLMIAKRGLPPMPAPGDQSDLNEAAIASGGLGGDGQPAGATPAGNDVQSPG